MRPRKPVLLFCSNLLWLSIASCVLETRCTWAKITAVHSLKDVDPGKPYDCIVMLDGRGVEGLIRSFDRARVILVSRKLRVTQAGKQVIESDVAALLDAMRVTAVRKRGPRSRIYQMAEAA